MTVNMDKYEISDWQNLVTDYIGCTLRKDWKQPDESGWYHIKLCIRDTTPEWGDIIIDKRINGTDLTITQQDYLII